MTTELSPQIVNHLDAQMAAFAALYPQINATTHLIYGVPDGPRGLFTAFKIEQLGTPGGEAIALRQFYPGRGWGSGAYFPYTSTPDPKLLSMLRTHLDHYHRPSPFLNHTEEQRARLERSALSNVFYTEGV